MRKIFKIELHWQIIIAIILAVIFGIANPTKYKFTIKEFSNFQKYIAENNITYKDSRKLQLLIKKPALSEKNFFNEIQKITLKKVSSEEKTIIKEYTRYNPALKYISWLGIVFMRALKMIIIPLILSSIISGIANIGSAENLGRLGLKTLLYYLATSTLAIITGLFFVNIFKPGMNVDSNIINLSSSREIAQTSFSDILINIVPENIFESLINQHMLSIIFFSIIFGFFITKVDNKSRAFMTNFFKSTFEVMMKVTMFIIKFTPLGVFGIIAVTVANQTENLLQFAGSLGLYSAVVLISLFFHATVNLPLIVRFIAKANPLEHYKAMRSALLTAFSTSSSSATLSLTLDSVKNKSGVSTKVAGFTLPLGATVNMDGTALYEAIAAIFIAQVYGYDLSLADQIIVMITALLASIGAAGIPMAGMVMLSVVLSAVGLPMEGIGLIIAVDRILDMFRTAVNVWSDSCAAVVVAKSEGETLKV